MKKPVLALSLIALTLSSCQYFQRQVPSKDELLEQELRSINWQEVDEWPSVATCDSLQVKEERRNCFVNFISSEITSRIAADTLTLLYPQLDTIPLKVAVLADSTVRFTAESKGETNIARRQLDSVILSRLSDFPKVSPAIKRGLPVQTEFRLPIILDVQKRRRR